MSRSFELPYTEYAQGDSNGRVNLEGSPSAGGMGTALTTGSGLQASLSFPGFDYQRSSENQFQADMLRGNWEQTDLSKVFFSSENISQIQNKIRRTVFEKSQPKGYVIDDQSVDELKIIMRALYYQYSRNLPYDISGQIDELNDRVVQWSVPHILSAVDHYHYYLDDISKLPTPLPHSVNVSRAGTKSLPLQPYM
jgi:hypothetical protein|uniref:Minor capsid protein P8 central region domain-containing protein n=1 Tax=viral metagenome TaxID=1070528 RepID=A0A6C0DPT4_9ZZZZ